jgi:hypothetical protein
MKKIFAALLIITAGGLFAKDEKIRVNLTVDELAFSINAISSIEISGEEVPPFMDLKKLLTGIYKKASSAKKGNADIVFIVPQARNFLLLMQRAKFRASEAFLFQGISGKIVDALKKIQGMSAY